MDASILAGVAGLAGVVIGKGADLIVTHRKSKPAEMSVINKRLESFDASMSQQRKQFDEAAANFRTELQQRIAVLEAELEQVQLEYKKTRSENIALTFKVAELEYRQKMQQQMGVLSQEIPVPAFVTTEINSKTTTTALVTTPTAGLKEEAAQSVQAAQAEQAESKDRKHAIPF